MGDYFSYSASENYVPGEDSELRYRRQVFTHYAALEGMTLAYFGTDNTDDYYPYFIFRHMPKAQEIGCS